MKESKVTANEISYLTCSDVLLADNFPNSFNRKDEIPDSLLGIM